MATKASGNDVMIGKLQVRQFFVSIPSKKVVGLIESVARAHGFEITEKTDFDMLAHQHTGANLARKIILIQMHKPAMTLGSVFLEDILSLMIPVRVIVRGVGMDKSIVYFPDPDFTDDAETTQAHRCMNAVSRDSYQPCRVGLSFGSADSLGQMYMRTKRLLISAISVAFLLITSSLAGVNLSFGGIIPADRQVTWAENVGIKGGIPSRTIIFTTLSPSGGDDRAAIQNALNNCPENQVVKLDSGTFRVSGTIDWQRVRNGVVLRGTGPANTTISFSAGNMLMRGTVSESALSTGIPFIPSVPQANAPKRKCIDSSKSVFKFGYKVNWACDTSKYDNLSVVDPIVHGNYDTVQRSLVWDRSPALMTSMSPSTDLVRGMGLQPPDFTLTSTSRNLRLHLLHTMSAPC